MTSYAMKGDRERDFDGYMSKPIDIRELLETVSGFLETPG